MSPLPLVPLSSSTSAACRDPLSARRWPLALSALAAAALLGSACGGPGASAPPPRAATPMVAAPAECPTPAEPADAEDATSAEDAHSEAQAQADAAAQAAEAAQAEEDQPELSLEPVAFADIPGWQQDRVDQAMPALLRSCGRLDRLPLQRPVGPGALAGTVATWRPICKAARRVPAGDADAARRFFRAHFAAYLAGDRGDPAGRFTGYYEAHMRGAEKPGGRYRYPIYKRPPELVMVELNDFYPRPKPRRVAGRVVDGRLKPYYTRAQISRGALAGRDLELFWVDDPVDALFAQIQGSGIVELPDGSEVRVGYAGKNGHAYTAIGRELLREGAITREEMSMQAIRAWFDANPGRTQEMINRNRAFVFFEREQRDGAIGAQGVVLTPERSVAVDPYYIPLSSPIFIDTEVPDPDAPGQTMPFRQLVIAQDTGGAIRGPVRGDIFWGAGERAFAIAGQLKGRGRYHILLPRAVAPKR
ncbi:MltA domain-containing protein [Haliangium ochraceum]|uniref:peptidoglycan lytic exotransglycosylase n=1 Tax=Haliangium ochraceum (strain DSM 14365 / JCM 11303 / SMP-2) TaxID=502025 RepID=D0LSW2_HALO1|nr:MltA domain-containing protein [Haliangium ochraceum]ACY17334.1 MltA domain protein [Haliangium ochraceum DSM 14365]